MHFKGRKKDKEYATQKFFMPFPLYLKSIQGIDGWLVYIQKILVPSFSID